MAIFKRLTDILRANLNALLERAEDPEKTLKLIISDMEEALRKATVATAQAVANERRLKAKYEQAYTLAQEWMRKAEEALKSGREDLAIKALEKKNEYESLATRYKVAYDEAHRTAEELKDQLDKLKAKLEEARTRYITLTSRHKAAKVQKEFAKYTGSFGEDVFGRFGEMEERIRMEEEEAKALVELSGDSLQEEYEELEKNRRIKEDLAKLKAKLKREG
ncbi:MAG: PspA/IM30 family protein [Thermotogae bacterium]|nr:PspA/IM30 family protein [Thermotogota bacterium]